jgi:Rrf2 family nitric oxide-sensitive transcriptional repressor
MRLTVRTNLAMRILMDCAVNAPRLQQAGEIARRCNASPHHVAQVVSRLAEAGFVTTSRGRSGGLGLARPAETIRVGRVVRLFEASVPFTECMDAARNSCPLSNVCRLRPAFCRALERFYADLDTLSLDDLVSNNDGLADILAQPGMSDEAEGKGTTRLTPTQ